MRLGPIRPDPRSLYLTAALSISFIVVVDSLLLLACPCSLLVRLRLKCPWATPGRTGGPVNISVGEVHFIISTVRFSIARVTLSRRSQQDYRG